MVNYFLQSLNFYFFCSYFVLGVGDGSKLKMQIEKRNDGKSQRSVFTSKDKVGESKQKGMGLLT